MIEDVYEQGITTLLDDMDEAANTRLQSLESTTAEPAEELSTEADTELGSGALSEDDSTEPTPD